MAIYTGRFDPVSGMPIDLANLFRVEPGQAVRQGYVPPTPMPGLGVPGGPPIGPQNAVATVSPGSIFTPVTGGGEDQLPAVPGNQTILKIWSANGTPFVLFLDGCGRRRIAAWSRRRGTWKVYSIYKPLVLGKRMTRAQASRAASRLAKEASTWAKVFKFVQSKVQPKAARKKGR